MDRRPRIRSAPPKGRAGQRGFSFIELLVVMGIVGVLVGGVLIVIAIWGGETKPRFETRATLTKLKVHIEDWQNHFETYPPTDLGGMPNAINVGNESVNQALLLPGAPTEPSWGKTEEGNLDADALRRAVNRRGTTALTETLDGYGNPYVYLHARDYARHADAGVRYAARNKQGDLVEVAPRPHRRADGGFRNPRTFQLFSMGADGVPNTDDDITIWD